MASSTANSNPGKPSRPLSPHLGIYKWGPHMTVSIVHRATGIGLSMVGLPLFVWWLAASASGAESAATFADIFTYSEHRGPIQGRTVAWIGDGNNMANTWAQAAALLGFELRVSTPRGYEVDTQLAALDGASAAKNWQNFADPLQACTGADLVTTDVWTSMGYEAENDARKQAFADWCVDAEMMRAAKPDALFMHCLPAHRGEEVTAEVIDGPQSVVWDEAENRMHVQKALMEYLLLGRLA